VESVTSALDLALRNAEGLPCVVVTGSLFIAAEAEEAWARHVGAPPFETDYD
jgi:folylpolyglutamate synthase/dihydropteroate synthase